jgi:hypothetical protein
VLIKSTIRRLNSLSYRGSSSSIDQTLLGQRKDSLIEC